MARNWIGSVVSVDCGDILGSYQGQVSSIDEKHQTISLVKAYRNGIECKVPEITISAQDIQDLKILKAQDEHNNSQFLENNPADTVALEKHITDLMLSDSKLHSPNKSDDGRRRIHSVSENRQKSTTPKKIEIKKKWQDRDEACFSAPVDSYILENDFDFEKNLALFDKQAVYDEINAASKPDVVRLVDCNKRPQKYRCDENVLEQVPVVYRQILVPFPGDKEFVTDTGLVVPSIHPKLRAKLLLMAEQHGVSTERQLEMIGRSASEMTLQLLGGSYRINPQNQHQRPLVVILCGPHFQGAQGANCGRHLSNHGASVILFVPGNQKIPTLLSNELNFFRAAEGTQTSSLKDLPTGVIDIIVNAMDDHENTQLLREQSWYKSAVGWAAQCKAPVLTLDPPVVGVGVPTKWSLVPALPLPLNVLAGNIYLCDLGIPRKVFAEVGITYSSPFGAKFVIALHVNATKNTLGV